MPSDELFSPTYSSSPRAPTKSSCPQPVAVIKVVPLPPSPHNYGHLINSIQRADRLDYVIRCCDRLKPIGLACLTVRAVCHIACARQACQSRFYCGGCKAPGPPPRQDNCRVNHAVVGALMMSMSRPDRPDISPRAGKSHRSPMGQRVSIMRYSVLHKLRSSCLWAVPTGILRGVGCLAGLDPQRWPSTQPTLPA